MASTLSKFSGMRSTSSTDDAEPLLDENHEPEQAQRVKDARLKQRRRVTKRQQGRVLDEFPADVVVDDRFQFK